MIDADAARCKRSGEKHLEALLARLLGFGDPDIQLTPEGVLANVKSLKRAAAELKKVKAARKQKGKSRNVARRK
jgi:hypothetical protein